MSGRSVPLTGRVFAVTLIILFGGWHIYRTGGSGTPTKVRSMESGSRDRLVLITSSGCVGSRGPTFRTAIGRAIGHFRDEAAREGRTFVAAAVSIDWAAADGVNFLLNLADFDEVSAGSNWLNAEAIRLIWDPLAEPTVPQLLLLRKEVSVSPTGISTTADSVVWRVVGADAILRWIDAEARPGD